MCVSLCTLCERKREKDQSGWRVCRLCEGKRERDKVGGCMCRLCEEGQRDKHRIDVSVCVCYVKGREIDLVGVCV